MATSPDSVTYATQDYGLLAPLPAYVINIQNVPGADPTGNDDSTLALNTALASLPDEGGELIVAPGIYKITGSLLAKSNTTISGPGTIKGSTQAEWLGSTNPAIINVNYLASTLTDSDITIRGLTIDFSDRGANGGLAHCIYIRKATRIVVEDCTIIGGASSVALPGCDDTQEIGNRYLNFLNCGPDHWDDPSNARVIGCHIQTTGAAQMVNFNAEPSGTPGTGHVANGFTMMGCTLVSTAASATPCQIEPLATGNTVKNVTITGNTFKNVYLVLRGDVRGGAVCGNEMSDFQGTTEAITGYSQFGVAPSGVQVFGNTVRDPLTSLANVAVIRMASPSCSIFGNSVLGSSYLGLPFSAGGTGGQVYGNYAETGPVAGVFQTGFRLLNGSANYYGWIDSGGNSPRMYIQSDDNWIWQGTGAAGVDRFIATLQMRSSSSEMNWAVPFKFASYTRSTPATVAAAGTVIAGATALTADINNVTTCTAGVADGVSLQPVDGQRQTVINSSAATLKVYPNNSGSAQIDAGGASIPTTIAAGKSKTFTRVATNDFRTISAT